MSVNFKNSAHASVMREADLPKVMIIEQRNYSYPWTHGIFSDCLKAGYIMQVLRLEDELIGYGVMQVAADEAHILNLCVDKDFSRRGYARGLLEKLLVMGERAGAYMAFLEARPSVPRAITLYERAGFNEVGIRKNYYESPEGREDAIVMARTLGDPFSV